MEELPVASTEETSRIEEIDPNEEENEDSDKKTNSEDEWTELDKDGWENVLGSGRLRRKIITAAKVQEIRPTKGDYVKISLKGKFEDKVFQESDAFEFNTDEAEVIRALDLVIALMYPGETDEFVADPELAYGTFGFPPILPSNAAVHYEVTLLEVEAHVTPFDLEVEDRKAVGLRKKDRGNFWFSCCDYSMAVQCYRKAVDYFDDSQIEQLEVAMDRYELSEPLQELVDERIKVYNNLAQAQIKLEAFDSALASLKNVLKLDPNNEKGLFRKAKAYDGKGEVDLAVGTLRRITRLYKENKLAQSELQRLLGRQANYNQKAKEMSKKMLELDKYEAEQAKKKANQGWRQYLSQTLVLSVAMGGFGALLGGAYAWYSNVIG